MAEGLLRHMLERQGRADEFYVASAGCWTTDGHPASQYSVLEMIERGIDISRHRSRELTGEMVEEAALILTMTRNHAEAIRAEFPTYADRVHTLYEMAGAEGDVEDPIGGTRADYQRAAREIEKLIEDGYPEIMRLAAV